MGPADLIRRVLELTKYNAYLEMGDNSETRIENVHELMAFAKQHQDGFDTLEMKKVTEDPENALELGPNTVDITTYERTLAVASAKPMSKMKARGPLVSIWEESLVEDPVEPEIGLKCVPSSYLCLKKAHFQIELLLSANSCKTRCSPRTDCQQNFLPRPNSSAKIPAH